MGVITFAGRSSDDVRVIVERFPERIIPQRRVEQIMIPGRSGPLIQDGGAFEGYEQIYEVYLSAEAQGLPTVAREAAAWICAPVGYQRLWDSYDPSVYRMAYYSGPVNLENTFNHFGRGEIRFFCKPQRYLLEGDEIITLAEEGTINNPTAFASMPLITIQGSGAATLQVGDYSLAISSIPTQGITVDSELQNAQNSTGNVNNLITKGATGFPKLEPGANRITWSGEITSVEISPRWWTL